MKNNVSLPAFNVISVYFYKEKNVFSTLNICACNEWNLSDSNVNAARLAPFHACKGAEFVTFRINSHV